MIATLAAGEARFETLRPTELLRQPSSHRDRHLTISPGPPDDVRVHHDSFSEVLARALSLSASDILSDIALAKPANGCEST